MSHVVIRYLPGGQVRKIYSPGDRRRPGGAIVRRASHVEPQRLLLRLAFHLLRKLGSDESRLAQWTRNWPCAWRARILLGERPIFGPYKDRLDAIQAELHWLQENWVLATDPGEEDHPHGPLG